MANFIMMRRGRSILSGVMHVLLNLLLAIGSIAVTVVSGSWLIGVLLVFLSKWRIVAAAPRYWLLNLKSNMVDIVAGVGIVIMAYYAGSTFSIAHFVLAIVYAVWLILIKPRTGEVMTEVQSLVAVFFGIAAATLVLASMDAVVLVVASFIIGCAASRHVLSQSDDHDFTLVTFVCGLICAELTFVLYHWLIIYRVGGVIVSQLAIMTTLLAYVMMRTYKSAVKYDGKIKASAVLKPAIFSAILTVIMIVWFSRPIFNV